MRIYRIDNGPIGARGCPKLIGGIHPIYLFRHGKLCHKWTLLCNQGHLVQLCIECSFASLYVLNLNAFLLQAAEHSPIITNSIALNVVGFEIIIYFVRGAQNVFYYNGTRDARIQLLSSP
ncbi:hypothetical protein D3C78_973750 [compost metagenome]